MSVCPHRPNRARSRPDSPAPSHRHGHRRGNLAPGPSRDELNAPLVADTARARIRSVRRCAIAAAAALTMLVAGGCASQATPREVAPQTGFGGYRWWGRVHDVSARWQVPTILSVSRTGHASTWIGAQNLEGGYPFIQVGTTEDDDDGFIDYEAFWSDSDVSFHPQNFNEVSPGDIVEASMSRSAHGWTLRLDDLSDDDDMSTTVAYGADGIYNQAEWLQEDPTPSSVTAVDLPYPHTSTVRFSRLEVNDHAPRLDLHNGQTLMASDDINLVPTPLRADAFALVPPTAAAGRYLQCAARLDRVINRYNYEFASWSSRSLGQRRQDIARLLAAYAAFDADLNGPNWPPRARTSLRELVRANDRVVAAYRAWLAAGANTSTRAGEEVEQAVRAASSSPARASLGLPPV